MASADKERKTQPREVSKDRNRGRKIVEDLRRAGGGNYPMTTDEIMRLTRGEDWGAGGSEEDEVDPVYLCNFTKLLDEIDRAG